MLKTVGLFCLMAQSGLHVPAASASLPVFRDILADIGDGQSITQSLSTFSSHIRNIISIIQCACPDTLVLLDELGTGTDPGEGMGLATAVLEELKRKDSIILQQRTTARSRNLPGGPRFQERVHAFRYEHANATLYPEHRHSGEQRSSSPEARHGSRIISRTRSDLR